MNGQSTLIDLTDSRENSPRQTARVGRTSDTIDLTQVVSKKPQVVDLARPAHRDGAGPSDPVQNAAIRAPAATAAVASDKESPPRRAPKRKRLTQGELEEQIQQRLERAARKTEAKAAAKLQRQAEAEAARHEAQLRKAEHKAQKAEEKAKRSPTKKEKRLDQYGKTVRFATAASIKIKERMARALPDSGHRLFLMDRRMTSQMNSGAGPSEDFTVLGATANVYSVSVGKHPNCTCPDFQKGNVCKHYLFVMLRVLRLDKDDPLVWQKALLTREAEEVLGGTRSTRADPDVLADQSVINHYNRLTGRDTGSCSSSAAGPGGTSSKQRPVEGECAICYDTLKAGSNRPQDKVTFCQDCGNNLHVECFKRWSDSKKESGETVTCVYCRCPWHDQGAGDAKSAAEYVNLRDVSHQHQGADTSLDSLYGDTAVWIRANSGQMGRRQAANVWRLSQAT